MTNMIAVCIGLFIVGVFALDHYVFEWELPQFLMRQLLRLTEYIAFWR